MRGLKDDSMCLLHSVYSLSMGRINFVTCGPGNLVKYHC